ncbi:MAG: tRNA (adenosine(37)-N6)-threonylcarbamoyltransferase complex ATPase subunit type 1 TsaE [Chitinophagaceae bacterium]|nr:tRNA (adenosine(37)-N6)-threonylcarbamoyltransferase complex ATPase subunit type 1 TsaE [Chitinophagaceae bacterium]MCB9047109.1 tRNA (adenosine(37)-N6)-threonylcarbamoyltransferase complex ATPase subunit type 1 TsaE [Chitinophagales bacterium]
MEQDPILQISYSLSNIRNAAHKLWECAHHYKVWALSGQMGAGKTTLIHALCDELGVQDDVSSPTFALINHYSFDDNGTERTIYHMDWYRLKDEEEAVQAGVEDCLLQKEAYSIVEWPEQAPGLLPYPHLKVTIENTGGDERKLNVWLINNS